MNVSSYPILYRVLDDPAEWASHAPFRRANVEGWARGDHQPALIYADWLEEQGDVARAETIRLQVERDGLPLSDPRRVRLDTRLEWLCNRPAFAHPDEQGRLRSLRVAWLSEGPKIPGVELIDFRGGMAARGLIWVDQEPAEAVAERLARVLQETEIREFDFASETLDESTHQLGALVVQALLLLPSDLAQRIQLLHLPGIEGDPMLTPFSPLDALARSGSFKGLRELAVPTRIHDGGIEGWAMASQAFPNLARLSLSLLPDGRILDQPPGQIRVEDRPTLQPRWLLEGGLLQQLDHLWLGLTQIRSGNPTAWGDLARLGALSGLRSIALQIYEHEIENVLMLLDNWRGEALETLWIRGASSIRSASLFRRGLEMGPVWAALFSRGRFPALCHLSLEGLSWNAATLSEFLTATDLDRLTHLGLVDLRIESGVSWERVRCRPASLSLVRLGLNDRGLAELAQWQGLESVVKLDLSHNEYRTPGLTAFVNSGRLTALREWDLSGNRLNEEGVRTLLESDQFADDFVLHYPPPLVWVTFGGSPAVRGFMERFGLNLRTF